jgi:hypothetical protein
VITRGSPDDSYFQHHRHNTKKTQFLSSDSAGTPWSTTSSSFPNQKKAHRLENKTDLLREETDGNKSTSPDDILIHHQPFASQEPASVTYSIF